MYGRKTIQLFKEDFIMSEDLKENTEQKQESWQFKAEVGKVLDIVINSLYSDPDIFLRELISNSSDACDKLRYYALTHPDVAKDEGADFKIEIIPDEKEGTLIVRDNGIGMSKDELVNNLGTVAKSGSEEFAKNLTGDRKKDSTIIGQFGVGFYSAFMVAEKVEVRSKKAGEKDGHLWVSDAKSGFTVSECPDLKRGTEVKLFLKESQKEYASPLKIRNIVRTYSDHISIPIVMIKDKEVETINTATALWTRNKAEITADQYKEFYHSTAKCFDDPWMTIHYKAEGTIEYTALLFIPTTRPFDLFQPDKKKSLRLYTNRVFISDEVFDLMPNWLRFVKGIIDTKELPLNVSREMLQKNALLVKIRNGVVKKILNELKAKAEKDPESYNQFFENFGSVLKEGLYEDAEHREEIAELLRFNSSKADKIVSFADYMTRMKDGQKSIFYITGEDAGILKNHPQIESFKAKDVEVLLLTDPIDEFWPQAFPAYKMKQIKHVAQVGAELDALKYTDNREEIPPLSNEDLERLTAKMKMILNDEVKDIRPTTRLDKSPACISAEEGDMSLHLEKLMKKYQQQTMYKSSRILEINSRHPMIKALSELVKSGKDEEKATDVIRLIYDQSLINEGETVKDPAGFADRLAKVILAGLK